MPTTELPSINALEKLARLVTTVPWQANSVEVIMNMTYIFIIYLYIYLFIL